MRCGSPRSRFFSASVLALYQDNLKARLAFSTISQLSYIVLGGALLTTSGMVGGIAHITNHAVSKITLFFCAGSIYASAHKTDVSQMSGLARKMPWTMAAFAIASLSLVGIPPSSGFVSKWYLALGSVERGNPWVLAVLLVSSLLNAAYLGPVVYKAYFEVPAAGHDHDHIREVPLMVVPHGVQRRPQPAPGDVSRSDPEAGGNGEAVTELEDRAFYAESLGWCSASRRGGCALRFLYDEPGHFAFEDWPAFGSIYGFLSCVAIILVSKFIGKHLADAPGELL